jgi:hypothetical protein
MQRLIQSKLTLVPLSAALILAGCGSKAPVLPDDPIEKAASCGVIAAASERNAAGAKGELPPAAQERIFHYALLAGSTGKSFDEDAAQKVFQRSPKLFDTLIVEGWESLRPACATAFPQTQVAQPTLPAKPLDSMQQCYVLTNFMRRSLGSAAASYGEISAEYGRFIDKLDGKLSQALNRAGIKSDEDRATRRADALAAAARMGQPSAVIAACMKKYG